MKKFLLICFLFFFASNAYACAIDVKHNNGIYHIVLSGNSIKKKIKFVSSSELKTNKDIHEQMKSKLTINTGFFDPKNQKTISYIVDKDYVIEDPITNENLLTNPTLRENLNKILNRTEFRITDADCLIMFPSSSLRIKNSSSSLRSGKIWGPPWAEVTIEQANSTGVLWGTIE